MCARVVASAGKNTKRAGGRPGGGVEGRALTTDAPPPNTNRSRNTESSAAAAAAAAQQSVVGESVFRQSFTTRPALRSSRPVFFFGAPVPPSHGYGFRLLSVFFLAPSRHCTESVFVTYPHRSSPFDRTVIIINRPYPVHVVNTVRF